MDKRLTKDAKKLLALMYNCYIERRKRGIDKSQAREIGSVDYINETFVHEWSYNDTHDACAELYKNGLVIMSVTGHIDLTKDCIVFMENRTKDVVKEYAELIGNFIP